MLPDASHYPLLELAVSPDGHLHVVNGTDDISAAIVRDLVELNRASGNQPNADKLARWGFE